MKTGVIKKANLGSHMVIRESGQVRGEDDRLRKSREKERRERFLFHTKKHFS